MQSLRFLPTRRAITYTLFAFAGLSACDSSNSNHTTVAAQQPANYLALTGIEGLPALPDLPQGRPANLDLLEEQERPSSKRRMPERGIALKNGTAVD
ncbi:MAG: hypothetical protein IPG06_24360 [Haliea sp.]|nr:hypothetical protein [Haliea sp.]